MKKLKLSIILNGFSVLFKSASCRTLNTLLMGPKPEFLSEYSVTANQRGLESVHESLSAEGAKATPLVLAYSHFESVPSYDFLGILTSHKSKGRCRCNLGMSRMAQRSKNVSQGALDRVARWYFSPENLRRANDRLADFMHRMPIANLFKEDELVMRSASDGQKYTMAMDSIHATYSAKYFAGPPFRFAVWEDSKIGYLAKSKQGGLP